jgi:hypothetical protein
MTTIDTHSNKENPSDIPATKIVEAYGLRKCPKLVEQVCSDNVDVRVNALAVVCEEFANPYTVDGCMRAGIAVVLAKMISDPDYLTRERATRALALAARDANGVGALLDNHVVLVEILNGIKDPSDTVRQNVYECLLAISETQKGRENSVVAGIVFNFVDALVRDEDRLKVLILKTLCNIVSVPQGLDEALSANVVKILIEQMKESTNMSLVEYAAKTLAILCFAETAKTEALDAEGIPALLGLLKTELPRTVKVGVTMCLMAITSTTAGRIQMHSLEALQAISSMFKDNEDKPLRLNILKIICNIAVYPPIRALLLEDAALIKLFAKIKESTEDKLILKHVSLALEAVYWKP